MSTFRKSSSKSFLELDNRSGFAIKKMRRYSGFSSKNWENSATLITPGFFPSNFSNRICTCWFVIEGMTSRKLVWAWALSSIPSPSPLQNLKVASMASLNLSCLTMNATPAAYCPTSPSQFSPPVQHNVHYPHQKRSTEKHQTELRYITYFETQQRCTMVKAPGWSQ